MVGEKMKARLRAEYHALEPYNSVTEFFGVVKPRGGEFTLTVYAVNLTKTYGFRYAECLRAWSDRDWYVQKNVWYTIYGGMTVEWDEAKNRVGLEAQWYRDRWGVRLPIKGVSRVNFASRVRYLNLKELDSTEYRWCGYGFYNGPLTLVEYARLWRRHKGVELLSKANLWRLVDERACSKMERDRGFAQFVRANAGTLNSGPYTTQTAIRAYRNGWTLEKAREVEEARYTLRKAPKGIDRMELMKYLKRNDIDAYDYFSYCADVERAKEDILAFGVTFPRDFHEARKKMQKRIKRAQAREDRERAEALRRLADEVNALLDKMADRLAWRVGEYSVVVPVTRADFVAEGRRMRNCIGGYFDRSADGETAIFFLSRNGKRVADVESSPSSGAVRQCRGKCNANTDRETRLVASAVAKVVAKASKRLRRAA